MPPIHLKLDWLSSFLTVVSMLMVGRRQWWGWLVAALNCFVLLYIAHQSRLGGLMRTLSAWQFTRGILTNGLRAHRRENDVCENSRHDKLLNVRTAKPNLSPPRM